MNKVTLVRSGIFISVVLIVLIQSCKDDDSPALSFLTTTGVTEITDTTAISGGNITDDGGHEIIARGVCWGTSQFPTVSMDKTLDGSGTGTFSSVILGLSENTSYHVRAYATNSEGTGYGTDILFTTKPYPLATLTTTVVTSITPTSAITGGHILSIGAEEITERGVCWSTFENPTIADKKTSDGSGVGSFISYLTGLSSETTYYFRAYATNSKGTAYGEQYSFNTTKEIARINFNPDLTYGSVSDIEGNIYKTIQIGTQIWMAENLKTTVFNDNIPIPKKYIYSDWDEIIGPNYGSYMDDPYTYNLAYGKLYNWYVVGNGKLCPDGWRVPSDADLKVLIEYLGGEDVAGGKLKETGFSHWDSPNTGASNVSGFTALPGGFYLVDQAFGSYWSPLGLMGSWWGSTENSGTNYAMCLNLNGHLNINYVSKRSGFSVRCLKN